MLLRRIIEHVKAQNWTAVWLDFVIVVVGVFIGIQVNNWNEARLERIRATVYSERLLTELSTEYEYATALIEYYSVTRDAGDIAYDGLARRLEISDEAILINAYRASQYNWYERRRAVFDEIVSSGALDLISDEKLRKTAIGIYSTPVFSVIRTEAEQAPYRKLFRMLVEPKTHDDLRLNCGDKEYDGDGSTVGLLTLEYDCALTVSEADIAAGVEALRAHPEILPMLRLRNAEVAGRIRDLEITLNTMGVEEIYGGLDH